MSNRSARRATGVVAAAMVVALAIWALARLLGVELTVGKGQDASHVSAADAVATALLAGLVGLGVRAQLARRRADRSWPYVGGTALAISIIGPIWLADGLACLVLIAMHVAVGLVLIAGFTRLSPRPAHQHPTFGSESHQRS
jgi:FtsH-binding integral membrane protein